MNALRRTIAKGLRVAKSKPPRTLAEFLTSDVWIEDGPNPGRFRFETQPITRLFVDAFDSGDWTEFDISGPSQSGKTLIAFVAPLLYHTCEIGENYVLAVPLADMADNKWKVDVLPVLQGSPRLRKLLPKHGPGSAGGTIRDSVTLSNGAVIKLMGAGASDQGKAAFTARVVGVTEAAGFSAAGETSSEADPLRQVRARQRGYPAALRRSYVEGTLTVETELPWTLRRSSSQSTIPSPCVHCGDYVTPGRDDLRGWQDAETEHAAADLAAFHCPECGHKITEAERATMLRRAVLLHSGQTIDRRGRIKGPKPETNRLWFHWSAWHNLLIPASDLGRDEWSAAQIPADTAERVSADRELCQFVWSIPWVPPKWDEDLELDARVIGERRAHRRNEVPADTEIITTGVDMGKRVIWYLSLATRSSAAGRRRHVPDYGSIPVPSHRMELKKAIVYALRELWEDQLSAGYTMTGRTDPRLIDQLWYDAGWMPAPVLAWVRKQVGLNRKGRHLGAYGRGQTTLRRTNYTAPRKTGNEIREVSKNGLYYVQKIQHAKTHAAIWDSDSTKYEVQQALTLPEDEPGSITLFAGTEKEHERLIRHCLAERYVTEMTAIGERTRWVRRGANHLFDCAAMAWRASDRVAQLGTAQTAPGEGGGSWYD